MLNLIIVLVALIILNIITYIGLCRKEKRMTWKGYTDTQPFIWTDKTDIAKPYEPTNILCPDCGSQVYKDIDAVLMSNPPQHKYECPKCHWTRIM